MNDEKDEIILQWGRRYQNLFRQTQKLVEALERIEWRNTDIEGSQQIAKDALKALKDSGYEKENVSRYGNEG